MEQRIYHGTLTPKDIAQALMGEFNRGNFHAQTFGNDKNLIVQITTNDWLRSGGQTALSVSAKQVEDGVAIQMGKQNWFGVAASLGQTLFYTLRNPWNIIGRLDDLAQDFQSVQLSDEVLGVIEKTANSVHATFELSERLRRLVCEYCGSANQVGAANCTACGAPLGKIQPRTCLKCGFVVRKIETRCPNCGSAL